MTEETKLIIEKWIVTEISTADVVPADEGNTAALIYNLIHLLREGQNFRRYNYESDQNEELIRLGIL